MKKIIPYMLVLSLFVGVAWAAQTTPLDSADVTNLEEQKSDPDSMVLEGGMDGKISLDLRNIDIVDALK